MKGKFLALVLVVVLGIAISACTERDSFFLVRVESPDRGEILLDMPVRPGDQIYLDWIHSAVKTPVRSTFQVGSNGEMILVEEKYQWYGPGLEFMNHEGVYVTRTGEGTKVTLNRLFPYLLLSVGWVANQRLTVNDTTISLSEIAQGGDLLKIWIVAAGK